MHDPSSKEELTMRSQSTQQDGSLPAISHALTKLLPLTPHFLYSRVSPVTTSVLDAALADSLGYEHWMIDTFRSGAALSPEATSRVPPFLLSSLLSGCREKKREFSHRRLLTLSNDLWSVQFDLNLILIPGLTLSKSVPDCPTFLIRIPFRDVEEHTSHYTWPGFS